MSEFSTFGIFIFLTFIIVGGVFGNLYSRHFHYGNRELYLLFLYSWVVGAMSGIFVILDDVDDASHVILYVILTMIFLGSSAIFRRG